MFRMFRIWILNILNILNIMCIDYEGMMFRMFRMFRIEILNILNILNIINILCVNSKYWKSMNDNGTSQSKGMIYSNKWKYEMCIWDFSIHLMLIHLKKTTNWNVKYASETLQSISSEWTCQKKTSNLNPQMCIWEFAIYFVWVNLAKKNNKLKSTNVCMGLFSPFHVTASVSQTNKLKCGMYIWEFTVHVMCMHLEQETIWIC